MFRWRGVESHYWKVLAKGAPRIARSRPGHSRFTVVDPSGNNIIFIQRDEPEDLEYGGSKSLKGLARVVDNARILREFKNDDPTAAQVLDIGLRRFCDAGAVDLVKALTARAEIAIAPGEAEIARKMRDAVDAVTLVPETPNPLPTNSIRYAVWKRGSLTPIGDAQSSGPKIRLRTASN
ncbi:hypothetical protein QM716_09160 [Rhodococcus sp. IEGM 1409]|uniref:hypothetical protein n=1 Tax=Rhodococcus sp. IEGM 1409 TaxID=3047082 RepID=UPI0024B82946|nr:hypothetical protein [Rhodococcus sp. IEGM 1409]MDI9900025.1 hypothetical protein [Rhodococcus sp. IEGM 1409]